MTQIKRILFIDDEPLFLQSIARLLRSHKNWDLSFAESVDHAISLCQNQIFDLIISDIKMPGKDGFDLLKELQGVIQNIDTPVVMLTGNAEQELKRTALDLGATDLLNKPVSYLDLRARIINCLQLKGFQDEIKQQNQTLENKVKERTAELESLHEDIIWRLAKVGEYRDEDTGNHLARVTEYSGMLAQRLGLSVEHVNLIALTSCLHDIGKIGIPDKILLKPAKLTGSEWRIMQTHCKIGYDIMLESPFVAVNGCYFDRKKTPVELDETRKMAATIAMTHHEKWDGSGYPSGLKKEEIPIEGRIVALADVYDALRSRRPYKEPVSHDDVKNIITKEREIHFDPEIVDAFLDIEKKFYEIQLKLS